MKNFAIRILIGCLFVVFLTMLTTSCQTREERNEECINAMPLEVRDHVRSFLNHGRMYGKRFNLKKLRIVLAGDIGDRAGFYRHGDHIIYLDTTSMIWGKSPESLIYHELGHALLKREHNNNMMTDPVLGEINLSYMGVPNPWPRNGWHKQIMLKELFTVER